MAQGDVYNYSGDSVVFAAGPILPTNLADGEFLTIIHEADDFTDVCGTDGSVGIAQTKDGRATIELTLMQTSPTNDLFSALRLAGLKGKGAGIIPCTVSDKSGRSLHVAPKMWIKKPPEVAYGRDVGMRKWTFRAANMTTFVGGN